MELKMGCFVMMQSISFHLGLARSFAFTKAPDFFCASNQNQGSRFSRQRSSLQQEQ